MGDLFQLRELHDTYVWEANAAVGENRLDLVYLRIGVMTVGLLYAAILVATPLFGGTVVNGELLGLPFLVQLGLLVPAAWARAVKYMAKSPAKNISSLESQTMVPTLTMLGLFSECTRDVIAVPEVPTALVTHEV